MDAKYIVFTRNGVEQAICFPFCVTHRYIWAAVRKSTRRAGSFSNAELLSAGFYTVDSDGTVFAHGRSETLDLGSRVQDGKIIERLLQGDG
jgi:hypothetical protein